MKQTIVLCMAGLLLIASAVYTFGDIARPKVSPAPEQGKIVFHTGLAVAADANAYEARLQISEETLRNIRAAAPSSPVNESMGLRIMHSSPRTIMAGLFMFLAVSFAGVWRARSGQRRNQRVLAAFVLGAAMLSAMAILVRANAGPPAYLRWQNLPENLTKGQLTRGGLDIEIVPGNDGMKLIVPLKNKRPGEE
jgi:hypothetical protein